MFKNYALLFAICAALLLVGCGGDNTPTDTQQQDTQQEMQKDTTSDQMDKNTEGTGNDGMKLQDNTDNKDLNSGTTKDEGTETMKENMDKTMPEKNEYDENKEKTSGQPFPVSDVLKT